MTSSIRVKPEELRLAAFLASSSSSLVPRPRARARSFGATDSRTRTKDEDEHGSTWPKNGSCKAAPNKSSSALIHVHPEFKFKGPNIRVQVECGRVWPGGYLSHSRQRTALGKRSRIPNRCVVSPEGRAERFHSDAWLGFRNSLHQCSFHGKWRPDSASISRIGSRGRGYRWGRLV